MILSKTILTQDRLALFGYGLFETLLITESGPVFTDLHWQRMRKGADLLGLSLPTMDKWLDLILQFVEQIPGIVPYALRVTLSGGSPQSDLPSQFIFHSRIIPYTTEQYSKGIRLNLLSTPRNEFSPLSNIKSTNYLENILAKEFASRQGAEEGLCLNTHGFLCEGTMSNLFFIKEGTLYTPSINSGCLPGTRRQLIIDLARSHEIRIEEGLYPISDLWLADEIFMTNALMGVMPVRQIDDVSFPIPSSEPSQSIMRMLEQAYRDLIHHSSR